MKLCDGEFLKAVRKVSEEYPDIRYNEMIIDNCAMQLAQNPSQFDAMVLPNLYGSIVANIVSGITGGPGITPGANIGNNFALFEQGTRHLARDIEGQGTANPTSILLSSVMLLRHLNLPPFADIIQRAVFDTLGQPEVHTPDLGGTASTTQFTDRVINNIAKITN